MLSVNRFGDIHQRSSTRNILIFEKTKIGLEKQGSLFLWIGSLTGFERVTILSLTKLSYCSCPMGDVSLTWRSGSDSLQRLTPRFEQRRCHKI
ncbi:hypothetical protein ACOMHN_056521 [Nucella lapillus]